MYKIYALVRHKVSLFLIHQLLSISSVIGRDILSQILYNDQVCSEWDSGLGYDSVALSPILPAIAQLQKANITDAWVPFKTSMW